MEVWCGMIIGFDNDDATIFDAQREFIQDARIAFAMIGMLCAIPKTPLYDRLAAGGPARPGRPAGVRHQRHPAEDRPRGAARRLRPGDERPLRARAPTSTGWKSCIIKAELEIGRGRSRYWRRHPLELLKWQSLWLAQSIGLFPRLMNGRPRSASETRVPPAALAVPQGPPQPGRPRVLRHPYGPALPRLHHGHPDGLGPDAGLQLVLSPRR